MRILLAEDTLTLRWLFVQQLEKLGVECDCAADGRQAVEWFRKRRGYALILMDVMMPEIDGYEATRQIREVECLENLERTPIIAITCIEHSEACIAAGMDDHWQKPIFPHHLSQLITKWTVKRSHPQIAL